MSLQKKILIVITAAVAAGFLVLGGLLHYGFRYNASAEEQVMPLPGDGLVAEEDRMMRGTCAITIDSPPSKVWPYIIQMGQNRAGFYSFERLERFFGFDIHNVYNIRDEWQKKQPGEWWFYHQNGIGTEIKEVSEGSYFTSLSDTRKPPKQEGAFAFSPIPGGDFAWTWNFILKELPGGKTRLFSRADACWSPRGPVINSYVRFVMGVPSVVMMTKMLETIKECAEGNPPR